MLLHDMNGVVCVLLHDEYTYDMMVCVLLVCVQENTYWYVFSRTCVLLVCVQ